MAKEALYGKTLGELKEIIVGLKLPAFTSKQLADWLYKKHVTSIEEMSNLSKKARALLDEKYEVGLTPPESYQESIDGTKKYLFKTINSQFIESAYLPESERNTLCVSSQVGCKMGCLFCMTARQGFQKQLTTNEILNQIASLPEREKLTNLVYMGMGEPMDNIDNVLKSLEIITSDWGYGWSPRRINVSTIGVVPAMRRFIEESEAHLAISLHSPFNEERKQLMPIENVYSAEQVIEALRDYDFGRQRRISFEYIMFKGVNDSAEHVKGLTKLLNGIRCRINLIHFHPIPNSPLRGSERSKMEWFRDQLSNKGLNTTIRKSRGEDIYAACGLLSTKKLINSDTEKDY
ncbi:23S rRNA (adenine(2503)-C(2))-methyltransferase RlmN [Carboxylicivirga linearis]|uniref:Probable dual-specificity RNA methyltransferase RlmN n=1 Tax=Carboxylicivirga linearis TaxID=1628157 RepID=A0ABS5JSV8_9BACT|nr:23S rRNA (adenine(2503)-C(2))-methyltransferase RlmN [Carboxylicivirga linearis]MBS2097975.1 23S rRNA (adenine(2503)-C(2))-methyltransferase RlmN [Carboxylicivirga linearis]